MNLPHIPFADRKKSLLVVIVPVLALGIFLWFALLPFQKAGENQKANLLENSTQKETK